MDNPVPYGLPELFALAEDMADGLHTYEATVGVKQNTETLFRASLEAAQLAESLYATAKGAKTIASTDLRIADSNARAFLKAARSVLAKRYGEAWTLAWEPTGFPNQSTAVPGTQDERFALCDALNRYFTANPTHEVPDPNMNVTAAEATARHAALSDARQDVNSANTIAGTKRNDRDTAVTALKVRVRGLITELEQLLEDNDPRWDAFGLNAPGASSLPDVPEALVVTPGVAGTLLADWADARRAARYHVFKQVAGVDADFVFLLTVTDSDATLTGFTTGQTVKVRVTAVNDSGESLPSTEAQAVVT
jgi:hypothetical protein